jgi:hypothetical protein
LRIERLRKEQRLVSATPNAQALTVLEAWLNAPSSPALTIVPVGVAIALKSHERTAIAH